MSNDSGDQAMTKPIRSPLTERDEGVLISLYKYRYLTVAQLRRLHFQSLQTAGRRLRRLRDAGYVSALPIPGVSGHVETLTEKGAAVVAAKLGVTLADLQWSQPMSGTQFDMHLRYALVVSDFRIALTRACDASDTARLLGFIPAHVEVASATQRCRALVHEVVTDCYDPEVTLEHNPDAVFALEVDSLVRLFFLEIDRRQALGIVGRGSFRHLVDFYESLRASDRVNRYCELLHVGAEPEALHVLVVVQSDTRRDALLSAIARRPGSRRLGDLFWVAVQGDLAPSDLLNVHWARLTSSGVGHTTLSRDLVPKLVDEGGNRGPSTRRAP
jgi:hypothetical protein